MVSSSAGQTDASARTGPEQGFDGTERWLDAAMAGRPIPPLLVVIGLGDGELLELLDRRAPDTRVLALEPDEAAAARFRDAGVAHRWRETGRLVYLADPDYSGADDAWRIFPAAADAHKLIVHPAVSQSGTPGAVRAARIAKQIIFGAKANADARRRFAPGYLTGTLHNLPEILAGHDVRGLTNLYQGLPAVIAGAGPSLDAALDTLALTQDRAVLIASDTALRPLLNHGLSPQLVVAVDPQALNARHLHALPPCPQTWLVGEGSIDPSAATPFGGRTFWFRVADHHPWPWFHELGIDVGRLDVWGSVLTAAFQVALLAGCDPIVLVGADLAFTGGRPYCRGTTYEFDWSYVTATGHSIERAWHPFLKPDEQIRVPDLLGGETVTTGYLQAFRDWLVARGQKSGRRVINATGAGIFFGDGIEQRPLADALRLRCAPPPPDGLIRRSPSAQTPSALASRLHDLARKVRRKSAEPPLDHWRQFGGDGFNSDAVGAALERAAATLERGASSDASPAAVIPWARLAGSTATRRVLMALPEALGRLRVAFDRSKPMPPAPDVEPADREMSLIDAFDILRAVCEATAGSADLVSPPDPDQLGRTPVASLLSWPAPMAWAVRLFEALLGAAWTAPLSAPPAGASFFGRPVSPRDAAADAPVRSKRRHLHPNADLACTQLALEWMLCARLGDIGPADLDRTVDWWRQLGIAVSSSRDAGSADPDAALVLTADESDAVQIPIRMGDARLARVMTGAVCSPRNGRVELARIAAAGRAVSLDLRLGSLDAGPGPGSRSAARPLALPRVLTDQRVATSVFAYATAEGAVCARLNQPTSVLIREDGSIEPHHSWPRPINGELPLGETGAVAWGVGKATWPKGGPGYVMFRAAADEPVTIEELPFGPTVGAWSQGRLYWTCFPFGLGSWAPGQTPTFTLADRTLYGVHPDAAGLLLHPRVRSAGGNTLRQLSREGWRWQGGSIQESVSLGPHGSASSQSTRGHWTATAHPEADLVRLDSSAGPSFSMICYYPFMVAWAGRSLVVCTTDGDVLLFDRLIDGLEARR